MVSSEQENSGQARGEEPLCEGYHWDSLLCSTVSPLQSRKRSLSESSLAPDRTTASLSLFSTLGNVRDPFSSHSDPRPEEVPGQALTDCPSGTVQMSMGSGAQASECAEGDSSCMSGAELNESHNGGKKRRAAGVSRTVPAMVVASYC